MAEQLDFEMIASIPTNSIIVDNRQRSVVEVDEDFIKSVNKRLINPITLTTLNDQVYLVAGGRRLEALKRGGVETLHQNTHFRFFTDLSGEEIAEIELEENIKREDLPWRDQIRAFGNLHKLLTKHKSEWTLRQTCERINISQSKANMWFTLYKNLDSTMLREAVSITQAYGILQLHAERRAADIVSGIINIGRNLSDQTSPSTSTSSFGSSDTEEVSQAAQDPILDAEQSNLSTVSSEEQHQPILASDQPRTQEPGLQVRSSDPAPPPRIVEQMDFLTWAPNYTGPKFNVIHVDFPYGIDFESFNEKGKIDAKSESLYENSADLYWRLLECFCTNLDRFCSYSAHVMFWFSLDYYERTRLRLESAGLAVNKFPLIWYKSDNQGIMPGAQTRLYPRRLYETAFLCTRSGRTLVKAGGNCYAAPHSSNQLHPSHKPESMLRVFLSQLVDETSDFFDPTCGSGAAIRVADDLGARVVRGLEIDPRFADIAEKETQAARALRNLNKGLI